MLFSSQITSIILLNSESLVIYTDSGNQSVKFVFPQGTVVRQEVIDASKLIKALVELFSKLTLGKKTLLVLGNDVVFYKQFSPPIANTSDPRIGELLEQMPFEREKIKIRVVNDSGISRAMAISHDLPQIVFQAAENSGIKVMTTVPLVALGNMSEALNADQVKAAINNLAAISIAEILHPERQERNKILKILILILVVILVSLTVVIASLLMSRI